MFAPWWMKTVYPIIIFFLNWVALICRLPTGTEFSTKIVSEEAVVISFQKIHCDGGAVDSIR